MKNNRYCVIMAGGIGSRFWPLSKNNYPKQFLDILGTGKSFIRSTYERFLPLVPPENFIVVTNAAYKELVLQQLPEIKEANVLCEPMRRNTAPCIAYAVYHILSQCPEASIAVTPADHLVTNEREFQRIIGRGLDFVEQNRESLMTIGIKPSRPETGYGYIEVNDKQADTIVPVASFKEKPDLETAKQFLAAGNFFWNSGIFLWKASVIREEMERFIPDVTELFKGWETGIGDPAFVERAYSDCPKISLDYGVMERTERAWLYPAKFGWADIDRL